MPADTGFPRQDVENDFLRVRRRQVMARLAQRLLREPDDVNLILPFDEVIAALGMKGERSLGLHTIRLDSVVGTMDSIRSLAADVNHDEVKVALKVKEEPGAAPK